MTYREPLLSMKEILASALKDDPSKEAERIRLLAALGAYTETSAEELVVQLYRTSKTPVEEIRNTSNYLMQFYPEKYTEQRMIYLLNQYNEARQKKSQS